MDTSTPIENGPLIESSETIKEIAGALSKFQASVKNVSKDAENPFFKSNYATLGNVIETIRQPLGENGLSFAQFPIENNRLVTMVMHVSGEYFRSTTKFFPKDNAPQSQGSAITYMRRYALTSILGIATEDDDGNAATGGDAKPASKPSSTKATTVKTGATGTEEELATLIVSIGKYSMAQCEAALSKLEAGTRFTDGQKDRIEKAVSSRIDQITSELDNKHA